jgi:hypothetical protein
LPTSPRSYSSIRTRWRDLQAVSACADDRVPGVLLFARFVSAGLQRLGLFCEVGVIGVDRCETELEGCGQGFVDVLEGGLEGF